MSRNAITLTLTAAIPIAKHQSLKIAYNNGAYLNYGGNCQNISVVGSIPGLAGPNEDRNRRPNVPIVGG
jgi:hypothetical protein